MGSFPAQCIDAPGTPEQSAAPALQTGTMAEGEPREKVRTLNEVSQSLRRGVTLDAGPSESEPKMHSRTAPIALLTSCALACVVRSASGQPSPATGLEIGAVPAVNFDSDEGFGYGAIAELYEYGAGVARPYAWTLQPTVFLTTEGRRDFTAFFDAPHLLPAGWRLTAFLGRQKQIATPYYGVGNGSTLDPSLEADDGPDPYFYRFGKARSSATFDLQRGIAGSPLRLLFGAGFDYVEVEPVPHGEGSTLYAIERGGDAATVWLNYIRGGFVWDTRDRETGPASGAWTEFLIRSTDESLAADVGFTRWTLTDRRYVSIADGLVFAHRYLVQDVSEGAPVFELFTVQTSFKQQEGLGGAKTLRGVPRNRYVGRGMLVWNSELRWRAADFRMFGRPFHTVLSVFIDQGRVWADGLKLDELLKDLHRGYGGGLRLGMGENFVVALDGGTSSEAGLAVYVGLGYLY